MARSRVRRAALCATTVASLLVIAAPRAVAGTPPALQTRIEVASGSASKVAVGDLDEDGLDDAVLMRAQDTVGVMLATGAGSFAIPNELSTAPGKGRDVDLVDVDGDHHLDIVESSLEAGIVVLLGAGDGTFGAPQITDVPAVDVELGDLAGDGDLDAMAMSGATVSVLEGHGDGTFATTPTFTDTVTDYAVEGTVHDLDGDQKDDLVVVVQDFPTSNPGWLYVYRRTGDGSFAPKSVLDASEQPLEVAVGDLDEDSDPDLVVAYANRTILDRYYNAGDGTFGAEKHQTLGGTAHGLQVTDLDGDSHLDLIIAETSQAQLTMVFADGTNGYGPIHSWQVQTNPRDLDVGDVDGDGLVDLVSVHPTANTTSVLRGAGGANFVGVPAVDGALGDEMAFGDLDGDGRADAVGTSASPLDGKQLMVSLAESPGTFAATMHYGMPSVAHDLELADLNGDGDLDIVGVTAGGITRLRNDGTGHFGTSTTTASVTAPDTLAIGDVDGDARLDAVASDPTVSAVRVVHGTSSGSFGATTSVAAGEAPTAIELGDLDGDGALDLVVVDTGVSPRELLVLKGKGDGSFAAPQAYPIEGSEVSLRAPRLALNDFDGDGLLDVATYNPKDKATSSIQVLHGDGSGGLGVPTTIPLDRPCPSSNACSPASMTAVDIDQDGAMDLVADLGWFVMGTNARTYATTEVPRIQREDPYPQGVADANGDGWLDLLGRDGPALLVRRALPRDRAPSAPFTSWNDAIDQLVRDLADRPATTAELRDLSTPMATGRLTPAQLVARLRRSADDATNVDPVTRLYRAYFLRNPDPSGYGHWLAARRSGSTLASISSKFARSSEFKRRYGSLSNKAFVELVYKNVLGRTGESGGVAFWTGRLDRGLANRGQVMVNFSESSEYKRSQASEVDVAVLYLDLLHRPPTPTEFSTAVALLDGPAQTAALADQLIDSAAYAARIG